MFAKGAVINANNELHGRNSYPYTIICEGRVGASIWMDTSVHGSKKVLMLAKEGSNWYDCRTTADLILDEASSIRLKIKKTGEKLTVFENISLDAFPKRPNKTTRVRLILTFTSEHTAMVRVQDLGFGEFFPSSGIAVSYTHLTQGDESFYTRKSLWHHSAGKLCRALYSGRQGGSQPWPLRRY